MGVGVSGGWLDNGSFSHFNHPTANSKYEHKQSLPPAPAIPEAERSAARSFLTEPKPASRGEQRFTALRTGA